MVTAVQEVMTAGEVAKLFRVSPMTVYRWADSGTLSAIRVGGTLRFRRSDVEALLRAPEPSGGNAA